MARIKDITEDWVARTLARDETWQAIGGSVLITDETTPELEDGIRLDLLSGIKIPSGTVVKYRRFGGSAAIIGIVGF